MVRWFVWMYLVTLPCDEPVTWLVWDVLRVIDAHTVCVLTRLFIRTTNIVLASIPSLLIDITIDSLMSRVKLHLHMDLSNGLYIPDSPLSEYLLRNLRCLQPFYQVIRNPINDWIYVDCVILMHTPCCRSLGPANHNIMWCVIIHYLIMMGFQSRANINVETHVISSRTASTWLTFSCAEQWQPILSFKSINHFGYVNINKISMKKLYENFYKINLKTKKLAIKEYPS